MLYVLAIFLPPVAVILCGRGGSALLNLLLTICFWVPGIIHAWSVISDAKSDRRERAADRRMVAMIADAKRDRHG